MLIAGAQSVSRGVVVELNVFSGDRECVVLGMGRIERDLSGREHCLPEVSKRSNTSVTSSPRQAPRSPQRSN